LESLDVLETDEERRRRRANGRAERGDQIRIRSFADFKTKFAAAGVGRFGSAGWVVVKDSKLAIESTPNQDNPLMAGGKAVMGLDVWNTPTI